MFTMRFDMRAPDFGAPRADLYRAAIEMAAWAEDKGCAAVQVCEHHRSKDGYLPAPMILAFFVNTAIDQQVEKHLRETGGGGAGQKKNDK